jgi:hypothetical protein
MMRLVISVLRRFCGHEMKDVGTGVRITYKALFKERKRTRILARAGLLGGK